MKTFKDTITSQYWQFEDDVVVKNNQFFAPHNLNKPLSVPTTLVPAELPPPPVPTLDELKAVKLAQINTAFESASATLTAGYPEAEQKTWPIQQAEILAWQANNTTPTPYLDGIATARGIDPAEMRQKTLDQTNLFIQASKQLVGTRQKLRDAINAATDQATLDAITWPI